MNITTTEIAPESANAAAKSRKTSPAKRRMAREPENTAATGAPNAFDCPPAASAPAPNSKIAAVIALLERTQGATLAEMVVATGWLPHTTRAALTGLKKKGHTITSAKADGVRTYRVVTRGAAPTASPVATHAEVDA